MHDRLRACLTHSARPCATAAAMRCSAAASASGGGAGGGGGVVCVSLCFGWIKT